MKYKFVSIILLLSTGFCSFANEQVRSGLFFYSHEVIKDKRTSLNLTPESPFVFKGSFSIEFDACFRRGDGYYGLISRIIADKNTNIDLVSNSATRNSNFSLVVKDSEIFSFDFKEVPDFDFGKWIKIKLEINLEKSIVALSLNDVRKETTLAEIANFSEFDIIFGAYNNPNFLNTDVSPMTLNDILIKYKGKNFRHWKLSKHTIDAVYDEIKGAKATVKNGSWLIDKHLEWEEHNVPQLSVLKGIAKNEQDGIVYFIGKNFMLLYHVESGKTDSIVYKSGYPFNNYYDCFVYNPFTKKIISYDLTAKQTNEFDFETQTWQYADFTYREIEFSHHNKIISPIDSSLVVFGGYGYYEYKAIVSVNAKEKDFSENIYPRYLSAAGLADGDEWLIFGGYGSKSGNQKISPQFFYDLHSYNLKTHEMKKIRDYSIPENPFVPCEALVKNPNSFYTLIYNNINFKTSLCLAEFGIDTDACVFFPDSIPYNFLDVESWCTLFLYKKTLIAITNHKSDVKIYTLAYPPLLATDVIQTVSEKTFGIWYIILSIVVVALLFFVLKKYFLKKENKTTEIPPVIPAPIEEKTEEKPLHFEIPKRKSKSSIYILGGFQAFDREGNDISASFSPTLKQLFVIILLYMVKNGRGISTIKLNETLWFDKTEDSARNNRNVTISKLRTLLAKVGEMDIVQESAYWGIQMEGVYSDYIEVMSICERLNGKNAVTTEEEVIHFVQIVSQGEMLPNMRFDWIDDFKANFSNIVIDTLLKISTLPEITTNNQLITHIADAIFKFDSINEDAIALKCVALCRLGKKGLAKTVYESFSKEYKTLLGTAFDVPFNKLVQ